MADFQTHLRFPTCKLLERLETDWQQDHSLPIQVARAQIEALRTAGDPVGRYRAKWQLVRNLYGMGYNAEELREIFRLIDWMMHLTDDLGQRFGQELKALEEDLDMPYVTSVERIAEARGEARGSANILLKQLDRVYGPLSEDAEQRIRELSIRQLEDLGLALLDFRSLGDLLKWLDAHAGSIG